MDCEPFFNFSINCVNITLHALSSMHFRLSPLLYYLSFPLSNSENICKKFYWIIRCWIASRNGWSQTFVVTWPFIPFVSAYWSSWPCFPLKRHIWGKADWEGLWCFIMWGRGSHWMLENWQGIWLPRGVDRLLEPPWITMRWWNHMIGKAKKQLSFLLLLLLARLSNFNPINSKNSPDPELWIVEMDAMGAGIRDWLRPWIDKRRSE